MDYKNRAAQFILSGGKHRSWQMATLIGGSIGHFIEWYDWIIYGLMAGVFSKQIFPAKDELTSLIATFAAFAVGFAARPIGAIVLSPMADKYGRRTLLSATILMASFGSLIVACCPAYAIIGIAAPIVIVAARLMQGFSAGGEFQIAVAFLNEHATQKDRALGASPQVVAIGVAILIGNAVSSATTRLIPAMSLASWGWRIPFLVGGGLGLYGLYIRRGLSETMAFQRTGGGSLSLANIVSSTLRFPKQIFLIFVLQSTTVMYYIWMIFLPTYANLVGGLSRADGFAGSIFSTIAYCVGVPLFAAISDRTRRKPFLISSSLCFFVFAYPLLHMLVGVLTFGSFVFVAITGSLFCALNNAVMGTVAAELFPTQVRASGIGIPYALSAAIFGGTAPLIATWLHRIGGVTFVALYVMLISAISLIVFCFVMPETRGTWIVDD